MSVLARQSLVVLVGSLFVGGSASALAENDIRVVNCAGGGSIQDALGKKNPDRPLTVIIQGTCTQDVTVTRDDVELGGENGAVNGTITVDGARRVLLRDLIVSNPNPSSLSNPTAAGLLATRNAAVRVERSTFERNQTNGILARRGAQVTVVDSVFRENGQETPLVDATRGAGLLANEGATVRVENSTFERNRANGLTARAGSQVTVRGQSSFRQNGDGATLPDTGRGIEANHDSSLDLQDATINNNRSDGVLVANGSYARLVRNTIEGNGRVPAGEGGVQVSRGRVRGEGNIITNNTGSAAIIVVNHGDYRTGTGLNAVDFLNNESDFERIEHRLGSGLAAIDLNNASYADLRQVNIVGSISVGPHSMLQIRGDDVGPQLQCSQVNTTGGFFTVQRLNGVARLRFTNVTGVFPTASGPGSNAQIDPAVPTCSVP